MRNLYSVLRVAPKVDDAELKSAFRNLAKTYHPDLKPGDKRAEERFREIARAYKFLSDVEARRLYDAFLADQHAKARQRFRRLVATMSCAFVLTSSFILFVMVWLAVDPSIAARQEPASKLELVSHSAAEHSTNDRTRLSGPEIAFDASRKSAPEHGGRRRPEITVAANAISEPAAEPQSHADSQIANKAVSHRSAKAEKKLPIRLGAVKSEETIVAMRKQKPPDPQPSVAGWRAQRWPTADEPFGDLGASRR